MFNAVNRQAMRAALSASTSLTAFLIGDAALAQTGANPSAPAAVSNQTVEDIIVTAQFRRQKLQDTPIAITAVTAAAIEAKSQTSIVDVAGRAPNVTLTPAGSGFGNTATASIRGVGQYDFNFGLEPGVGMYLDDVYYGVLFGANFDVADVERVEVLRGPQGTLAGKNSIGGAIKLFSKKPDENTDGYIQGTYGSFHRIDLKGAANLTLAKDKLYIRLSGMTKNRDGYMTSYDYGCATGNGAPVGRLGSSCEIGKEGSQHVSSVRGQLRWLVNDSIENNFSADISNDTSGVQASKLLFQGPWAGSANYLTGAKSYTNYATYIGHAGTPAAFTIPRDNTVLGWGLANNLDIKLSDNLQIKSITGYRRASGKFSQDLDASPADTQTVFNDVSHRQFSEEVRLSGHVAHFAEWTVGGYYYDARQTIKARVDINSVALDFLNDDVITSSNKSAFAHVVLHPIQNLSVTGGIRYSKEKKTYLFHRLALDGTPFVPLAALNGLARTFSGDRWDWRIGADYRWSPAVMTYVQASTGFKGGGVNPRPFFPAQVIPFGPEKLTAYEAGIKSDLFDRKLRLNAATFYNIYRDIQLTALAGSGLAVCPPGVPCAVPVNAGDAHVKGIEFEAELHPVSGLSLDGSLSYLDFQYVRLSPLAGTPGISGVQKGMVTPYTPKWKASGGIEYRVNIAGGSITPRFDWTYQSEVFTTAVNAKRNATTWGNLFSGKITYRNDGDDWEAALSVTNLGNKFYYLNKFDLSAPPFFVAQGQPARPREWAVSVKKRF